MFALLPFLSKKKPKEDLEIIRFVSLKFGYSIKNIFYFKKALRHKSFANNTGELSNERLEFLGDAILDSIIAEFLFIKFPEEDEGYLTKIKSKIVSRRTLGKIAGEMNLSSVMLFNKTRSINLETIGGNAFEALVGAIYLDGGYEKTKKSINNHVFRKYVNFNQVLEEEIDFKSKLFIWSQKNKLALRFEVVNEKNEGASWSYTVVVLINEKEYGQGIGSSKKRAEQAAAKETIELIG
ncbi:MAG: ribonuclease III [Fluviicola sp.]|nr:ribonuclease III [Fluviicola sp.]